MNKGGNFFLEALLFLLAFGSILFLTYITTKLIAGKASRSMKGRYIDIIETVSLGMDKKIHLVKIDRQFILIATSGKNIEFLTNVSLENYEDLEKHEGKNNIFDFKAFLDKCIQSNRSNFTGERNGSRIVKKQEKDTYKQNLFGLKSFTRRLSREKQKGEDENTNEKI